MCLNDSIDLPDFASAITESPQWQKIEQKNYSTTVNKIITSRHIYMYISFICVANSSHFVAYKYNNYEGGGVGPWILV